MDNQKKDTAALVPGLKTFHKNFPKNGIVHLEQSVMWYCLDFGINYYLGLSLHEKINFKASYFKPFTYTFQ